MGAETWAWEAWQPFTPPPPPQTDRVRERRESVRRESLKVHKP
jgi:hypothetical protein